jgi:hypothetical protein
MNKYNLVEEFKKALTERFPYSDISFLYQRLFFDFLIDEKDLNRILLTYQSVFIEDPYDWFRQFHKSVRQTDFFNGYYQKVVNMLTDSEVNVIEKFYVYVQIGEITIITENIVDQLISREIANLKIVL